MTTGLAAVAERERHRIDVYNETHQTDGRVFNCGCPADEPCTCRKSVIDKTLGESH